MKDEILEKLWRVKDQINEETKYADLRPGHGHA